MIIKSLYYRLSAIVLVLFLCLTAKAQESQFSIHGHILDSPSTYMLVYQDNSIDTISISVGGSFSFSKKIVSPQYATISVPKTQVYLGIYLQGGKNTSLTIDALSPQNSLIEGDVKQETEFMKQTLQSVTSWSSQATTFAAYQKAWDVYQDSLVIASRKINNTVFSQYLQKYLSEKKMNKNLHFYERLMCMGKSADVDALYNEYMERIDLNDDKSQKNEFVFSYLCWKVACMKKSYQKDYLAMLGILKEKVANQNTRDELAYRLLRMYLNSDVNDECQQVYSIVSSIVSASIKGKIEAFYNNFNRPKDSIVPNLQLLDVKGNIVNLLDICNTDIVYIDIWATYCAPCCREIPYIAQLQEKYASNRRIKFVSISLDKNIKTWNAFLQKQGNTWEQFVVPFAKQREFLDTLAINGIPRFLILGRSGKVIQMNAAKPSNPDVMNQIEAALH